MSLALVVVTVVVIMVVAIMTTAGSRASDDPTVATLDALVPDRRVAALVYDRRTRTFPVQDHPDAPFATQSLVKLLIALDALDRGTPAATVARMLSLSDDSVAGRLWTAGGNTRIVDRWAATIGLRDTHPPADPGRWGDTTTTAADMVRIYRYLFTTEAAGRGTVILDALRGATRRAADGVDQYFGIPDAAAGRPWAVKQGWACCRPGRDLHSTGVVGAGGRYVVVVLTQQPADLDQGTSARRVTSVVKALRPALVST